MNDRHWKYTLMLLIASMLAMLADVCRAQTATLLGLVLRDSLGHELSGAEVRISGLAQHVLTNSRGAFRIDGLPPGRYTLAIRHLGFKAIADSLEVTAGQRVEREFIMTEQAQELDSVNVTAPETKYISPNLRGFEERRKAGRGGYFITDSLLRRNDERTIGGMVAGNVPGIVLVSAASYTYLSSTRSGRGRSCWVAVFIDGVKIYDPSMGAMNRPDFNRINVREYAAVEFYPGDASLPMQYNSSRTDCGTLLLWTRER